MKMYVMIPIVLILLLFVGCGRKGKVLDGDGTVKSYHQISQEEITALQRFSSRKSKRSH